MSAEERSALVARLCAQLPHRPRREVVSEVEFWCRILDGGLTAPGVLAVTVERQAMSVLRQPSHSHQHDIPLQRQPA